MSHYDVTKEKKITNDFLRKFRFLDEVFASMTLKIPFALHWNRNAIISRVPATVAIWSIKWFVFILETEFRIA